MIAWMWAAAALAGTVELDNGAVITGTIAWWGDEGCAVAMDTGPLAGLEVALPCERIVAFHRGPMDGALAAAPALPEPVPAAPVAPAPVVAAAPVAPAPAPVVAPAVPVVAAAPVVAAPAPVAPAVADVEEPEEPRRGRIVQALQSEWRGVKGDLGFKTPRDPAGEAEIEEEGDGVEPAE